tara:strand:+ start:14595 stop:15173 length:579 start_codon:yes stop_codon:yes gene_type:complete
MNVSSAKIDFVIITPIGDSRQNQVIGHTRHFIELGSKYFNQNFDMIPVAFDLKGRTAGMYKWQSSSIGKQEKSRKIRYNPWIFAKYYEENLAVTVPHEVAHYLVSCLHQPRKVKPHGLEWKAVMQLFGADSSVTADFDMTGIPCYRHRRFEYICDCKIHQLGAYRHNKCLRGQACYLCRYCHARLEPKYQES